MSATSRVRLSSLPSVVVAHPHVVLAPEAYGSPWVVGTRVPVRRLWEWHRGGASVETIVRRYPNLGAAKVLDALSFAYDNGAVIEADLAREREMVLSIESDRVTLHGLPSEAPPGQAE